MAFPTARVRVRLDGRFAGSELFEFLDVEPGLDYIVATAGNAVLTPFAESAMVEASADGHARPRRMARGRSFRDSRPTTGW